MEDKNISFMINISENTKKSDVVQDNLEYICHNITPSSYHNSQQDNINNNIEKASAVWTTDATLRLLKLYEDKLQMLETPKKKTIIWRAIAESLKQDDIEMTPDQVRWKINALTKTYRQCIDRGEHEKCKYFHIIDNIYSQYCFDNNAYTNPEILEKQRNRENNQLHRKITLKPIRENRAMLEFRKTRLANRIQSNRSQSEIHLESQWLEYLRRQEKEKATKDEIFERKLKLKKEKLEIRKRAIENNNTFELHNMEMWKRKHETLLSIEIEKIKMLREVLSN